MLQFLISLQKHLNPITSLAYISASLGYAFFSFAPEKKQFLPLGYKSIQYIHTCMNMIVRVVQFVLQFCPVDFFSLWFGFPLLHAH